MTRKELKVSLFYLICVGTWVTLSHQLLIRGDPPTDSMGWVWLFTDLLFVLTGLLGVCLSFGKNRRDGQATDAEKHADQVRLLEALEASREGIWENNFGHRPDYFSPRMFSMLGFDPLPADEAFAWFDSRLHPDDREKQRRHYAEVKAGNAGDIYECEFRLADKQGDWRHILSRGRCLERDSMKRARRLLGTHVDVTQLRQVQAELKMNQERLGLALKSTGGGIWDIQIAPGTTFQDLDDGIYLSLEFRAILGLKDNQSPGSLSSLIDRVHPDDRPSFLEASEVLWNGPNSTLFVEYRTLHGDGTYHWLSNHSVISRDDSGRPKRWTGIVWDISEKKKAAERHSQENRVLRAVRNINQVILRELCVPRLLEAVCESLVKDRVYHSVRIALFDSQDTQRNGEAAIDNEVTSKPVGEASIPITASTMAESPLLKTATRKAHFVVVRNAKAAHKMDTCHDMVEMFTRLTHGGKNYGMLTVSFPRNQDRDQEERELLMELGRDIAFALNDIELRKSHETHAQALLQSNRHLNLITDNLPMGIAHIDSGHRYIFVNRAYEAIFGKDKSEIVGRSVKEVVGEEFMKKIGEKASRAMGGETLNFEETMTNVKGEELNISLRYIPSPTIDGKPGLIVLSQNITDRVRASRENERLTKQLQQSQKLEALGVLAGGIAHDFNNILASMLGFTELAVLKYQNGVTTAPHLNEVLLAGARAKELINQILIFSRHGESEFRPLNMAEVLVEALKLIRASLPSSIRIRKNIAPDLGPVMGEPTRLHQLIMNLCANAGHAMKEHGGILEITLESLTIKHNNYDNEVELSPGRYLSLTVSDTGHGIPENIQQFIFDPYFTTKPTGEGTGLGLSVVHGIVKEHGGHISFTAQPGCGASFRILLPETTAAIAGHSSVQETVLPKGHGRILVVDDEEQLVKLLKEVLEELGYQVTARTESLEALKAFRENPDDLDLVVTDLTMPHLTGDQLAREIKKARPDMPVILCTGYSLKLSNQEAVSGCIDRVMMKPVGLKALALAVSELMSSRQAT